MTRQGNYVENYVENYVVVYVDIYRMASKRACYLCKNSEKPTT